MGNQVCLPKSREIAGPKKEKKQHVYEIFDLPLFAAKEDTGLQRQNVARFVFQPGTKAKYQTQASAFLGLKMVPEESLGLTD